jgi:hypothetical protein
MRVPGVTLARARSGMTKGCGSVHETPELSVSACQSLSPVLAFEMLSSRKMERARPCAREYTSDPSGEGTS